MCSSARFYTGLCLCNHHRSGQSTSPFPQRALRCPLQLTPGRQPLSCRFCFSPIYCKGTRSASSCVWFLSQNSVCEFRPHCSLQLLSRLLCWGAVLRRCHSWVIHVPIYGRWAAFSSWCPGGNLLQTLSLSLSLDICTHGGGNSGREASAHSALGKGPHCLLSGCQFPFPAAGIESPCSPPPTLGVPLEVVFTSSPS